MGLSFDLLSNAPDEIKRIAPPGATFYALAPDTSDTLLWSLYRRITNSIRGTSNHYSENLVDGNQIGQEDGKYLLIYG